MNIWLFLLCVYIRCLAVVSLIYMYLNEILYFWVHGYFHAKKNKAQLSAKSVASVNVALGIHVRSTVFLSFGWDWRRSRKKSLFLEWNAMAEFLCGPNASGEGHRAKHCGNWSSPAVPEPRLIGNYLDCMLASRDRRSLFGYLTLFPPPRAADQKFHSSEISL